MMTSASTIQTADGVDLTHFEPEYMQRLEALYRDPRIKSKYYVESGSRSRAKQTKLYKKYKAGGNLAAAPGKSDHEYDSPPNHVLARATDNNPVSGKGGSYAELHAVAAEYGFHFNIPSELWHMVMRPGRGPIPNSDNHQEEDMPQPFSLMAPSGRGRWTLFPDGKVETTNFDQKDPIPFHGSMFDYPTEQSKPGRVFTNMQMNPTPGRLPTDDDGYTIFSSDKGAFMLKQKPK